MKKISIIMPVFNKEKYLKRCLESVLSQSYNCFEVLIINDGSTDSSEKIIEKFMEKDKRIRYFYQENTGVSSARNLGLELSTGDYITFLDADDYWDKEFLEIMYQSIEKNDICYCFHYFVYKDKITEYNFKESNLPKILLYLSNKLTPNTNSWLIRNDFLKENKILFNTNLSWGEDMLFFSNILTLTRKIVFVPKRLTYYTMSVPNSLSKNDEKKFEDHIHWINELNTTLSNNIKDEKLRNKTMNLIFFYLLPAGILYRIERFVNIEDYEISSKYWRKYYKYFNRIKVVNGLRSIKLILIKYKVYLKLKPKGLI